MDPKVKKNIKEFKNFFGKSSISLEENSAKNCLFASAGVPKEAASKSMIILNDPIKKKHFAISIENLLLLKSILPDEKKIKFDSNLIYNMLLSKKSDMELSGMLSKHDQELNR